VIGHEVQPDGKVREYLEMTAANAAHIGKGKR